MVLRLLPYSNTVLYSSNGHENILTASTPAPIVRRSTVSNIRNRIFNHVWTVLLCVLLLPKMATASFSLVKFLEGTVSAESYPGPSSSYLRTRDGRKHRYLAVLEQDKVSRDEVQRQEPSWRGGSGRAIDERDIHRGGEREERDEWLEQCFAVSPLGHPHDYGMQYTFAFLGGTDLFLYPPQRLLCPLSSQVLARHPDASALCHSLARPRAAHSALDASMESTDIGASGPPRSHFSSRALHATIQDSNGFATFQTPSSWIHLGLAFACVMAAAIASGLTIGLMSIEPLELEIKERIGTVEERSQAHRLLPLLNRRHLLLVTLLLFNAAAAEALPLFLDALVPGYIAVILSVTAVLFFGVRGTSCPSFLPCLPPSLPSPTLVPFPPFLSLIDKFFVWAVVKARSQARSMKF